MELLVKMDFFEEKSYVTKNMYFLYSLMGGMFYETYIHSRYRYFLIPFSIAAYVILTYATSVVLIQSSRFDILHIYYNLSELSFVNIMTIIALIVFLKRKKFRRLFHLINENARNETERNMRWTCFTKYYKFKIVWLMLMYFSKLVQKLTSSEGEFRVNYDQDFFFVIPSLDYQSFAYYIFLYSFTFVIVLPFGAVSDGSTMLFLSSCLYLKNQMIILINDMKSFTDMTYECLEECDRREERILETTTEDSFQLRDIAKQRARHLDEFMIKMQQWIKIHQRLILCKNAFRECLSEILAIQVTSSSMLLCFMGYFLTKIISGSEEAGFECIAYCVAHVFFLFFLCVMGQSLNDTNDILLEAVYDMPWYHLPTQSRKILLNFMCLTQKHHEIMVLKIFPLRLTLFVDIMNKIYDYIKFLITMESKNKR